MKKIIALALLTCLSAFAANTTVAQTIVDGSGNPADGYALIRISAPCYNGATYVGEVTKKVTVDAGAFSASLVPNDACVTAAGDTDTTYTFTLVLKDGKQSNLILSVPTSGSSMLLSDVIVPTSSTAPSQALRYQIIEDESTGLQPRSRLKFTGSGVTCTDTGGKTVCTVPGNTGGTWGGITGSVPDQTDLQAALDAKASATHATQHQNGGADEVATATPGANAIPKAGAGGTLATGWIPTLNQDTSGTAANLSGTPALPNGTTATTQSQADASTKLATTAYVDTGLGGKAASNASTAVNGQTCALGSTCTITADATPGGSDTNIQFNDSSALGGDSGLTYNKTTKDLSVAGGLNVGDGTVAGESLLYELSANGTNYRSWLVPDSLTASLRAKWPDAVPSAGDVLTFGAPSSDVSQTAFKGVASANTASTIVARDGSGNFSAGTVTATLSGNASTATALAADPVDCSAGSPTIGVNAAGTAQGCITLAAVATSGSAADLGSGTLPAARLPNPGASSLGGVKSKTCSAGDAVNEITTGGDVNCFTPSGGGGTGVGHASLSATWTAIADGGTQEQTATWTGVTTADTITLGSPSGFTAGLSAIAWVSASDTVTIRIANTSGASVTPGALTFKGTLAVFNLSSSGTINFGAIPDGGYLSDTFTLTGVAAGDPLTPKWPDTLEAGLVGSMVATATDTVTVTLVNWSGASVNPASQSFGASVAK